VLLGWQTTPKMTDMVGGGVRTAEAWRRRLKSREHIPLIVRSPRILATGIVCMSIVEYAQAFPTHGASGSLQELQAVKAAQNLGYSIEETRLRFVATIASTSHRLKRAGRQ
jgi:hypothetical protein